MNNYIAIVLEYINGKLAFWFTSGALMLDREFRFLRVIQVVFEVRYVSCTVRFWCRSLILSNNTETNKAITHSSAVAYANERAL